MFTTIKSFVLVVDNSLSDIDLLETAWSNAGFHQSIGIYSCTSCEEAMIWLHEEIPQDYVVTGVLVDLMLFDVAGTAAVDVLSAVPLLQDVPIVTWCGIDLGPKQTDRIKKSSTRVWKKPNDWSEYADFIRRFYNVLDGRATASRS
jgi:CheY-like chemotaxis protein